MSTPSSLDLHGARPRRPGPSSRTRVTEHRSDSDPRSREDRLAVEEPLEIRLAWPGRPAERAWITMRTPGNDFELAAGWVRHEGIVATSTEVSTVAYCTDRTLRPEQEFNVVTVTLSEPPLTLPSQLESVTIGSAACGVCGTDSVEAVLGKAVGVRWAGTLPTPAVVLGLPERMRAGQTLFDRTGGVHAAALATADGELLVVREDIGRHNAVDKVTGARMLGGHPTAEAALVVSGRAGFELVQKGLAAGVGSLIAVGAPTALAVRLAQQGGLALYGFTRADRAVQYV